MYEEERFRLAEARDSALVPHGRSAISASDGCETSDSDGCETSDSDGCKTSYSDGCETSYSDGNGTRRQDASILAKRNLLKPNRNIDKSLFPRCLGGVGGCDRRTRKKSRQNE